MGGGISGLTAAYRLRAAVGDDATITLFDPAEKLGGMLRTERVGGQPMDLGAEAFVLRRPEMPALLAELGLSARQRATTGARPLIYSGQTLHPLPADTVAGIPSSAASVAGLVDDATVARIDAEPTRPLSWQPGSDPAVAELVADRFGEQAVARSVDPLLGGVYAGSAATIGLRAGAPSVAAALDRGAASLTDAVRQGLPPAGGGPVFGALDGGYQVLIDELVAARPVRSGCKPRRSTGLAARLGAARRRPAATGTPTRWSWRSRPRGWCAWWPTWPRAASPPRAGSAARRRRWWRSRCRPIPRFRRTRVCWWPAGNRCTPRRSRCRRASGARGVTCSCCGCRSAGSVKTWRATASDDELLAWAMDDLAAVFGLTVDPVDVRVQRWIDAMPQYGPGHADLVAQVRAGLPPGLAVAGSYLDGIGVPACIAAAGRAVEALQARSGTIGAMAKLDYDALNSHAALPDVLGVLRAAGRARRPARRRDRRRVAFFKQKLQCDPDRAGGGQCVVLPAWRGAFRARTRSMIKFAFQLGDRADDDDDGPPQRPAGIDVFAEADELDVQVVQIVQRLQQMAYGSRHAIEGPDHNHIKLAAAGVGHHLVQPRASSFCSANCVGILLHNL